MSDDRAVLCTLLLMLYTHVRHMIGTAVGDEVMLHTAYTYRYLSDTYPRHTCCAHCLSHMFTPSSR